MTPARIPARAPVKIPPSSEGPKPLSPAQVQAQTWQKLRDEFLPSLQKWDLEGGAKDALTKLFRDGEFQLGLNFHQATLPVEDSADLHLVEGAGICARMSAFNGKLSIPEPIHLGGFYALAGLFNFCQVAADPSDHLILSSCDCSFSKSSDITAPIMSSPIGELFPGHRLGPVAWTDLPKLWSRPSGAGGGGFGATLLDALYEITLKAKIPTDLEVDDPPGTPQGLCRPLFAGLELYFDVPVLRKNLEEGRWRSLDFSGIREGSFLEWPKFNLRDLPLPEGFKIPEGRADLSLRFHPEQKTTEITLSGLDAQIQFPELFGALPVRAQGKLTVTLHAGGEVVLGLDHVKIETPDFPSGTAGALQVAATLNGEFRFQTKAESQQITLHSFNIKLEDIHAKSLENKQLLYINNSLGLIGNLQGKLELDYEASRPDESFHSSGELQGFLGLEDGATHLVGQNLQLRWDGGFQYVGTRLIPKLENFHANISGDAETSGLVLADGLVLKNFQLGLNGDGSSAKLSLSADSLRAGAFSLQPRLDCSLNSKISGEEFQVEGEGAWRLSDGDAGIDLGSGLRIHSDLRTWDWALAFQKPQALGPLVIHGDISAEGSGTLAADPRLLFAQVEVKHPQALSLEVSGKTVSKATRFNAKRNSQGLSGRLDIPDLFGKLGGQVSLRMAPGSDRFSGNFRIQPKAILVSPNLSAKDLSVSGSFQTPPVSDLLAKPRIFIAAKAQGRLEGALNGPISAAVNGSLRLDPEKKALYLWLNPKQSSPIDLGPWQVEGLPAKVEGKAQLQGTWNLVFGKHGVTVGGSGVGIRDGEIFLVPQEGLGDSAKVAAVSALSLRADQLWSIQRGTAYSGGEGIKLELDLNPGGLDPRLQTDSGKRHIVMIVDQLPLSSVAYWRLFAQSLQAGGKP